MRVRLFAGLSLAAVLLATFVALQALPLQAQATTEVEVPVSWSLKPAGLGKGDQFRLLFLSSTKRNGSSADIAVYNTWIQERAAAGHDDIQDYSAGFRVVGCTAEVDARDNTGTNPNTDGDGVPIYWLNGSKVAVDNTDFYNGAWANEDDPKNQSGNDVPNTSQSGNRPLTGCNHDGTKFVLSGLSRALGASFVIVALPNDSGANNGPISSGGTTTSSSLRPMYGLSQVFTVVASTDATLSDLELEVASSGGSIVLSPGFSPGHLEYSASVGFPVSRITVIPTTNDAGASIESIKNETTHRSSERRLKPDRLPGRPEGGRAERDQG